MHKHSAAVQINILLIWSMTTAHILISVNELWSCSQASIFMTLQNSAILFYLSCVRWLPLDIKYISKSQQSGANDSEGDCDGLWRPGAESFSPLHASIMSSIQQWTSGLPFDHHTYWYFAHMFTDHIKKQPQVHTFTVLKHCTVIRIWKKLQ